jgi:hypothetical protein
MLSRRGQAVSRSCRKPPQLTSSNTRLNQTRHHEKIKPTHADDGIKGSQASIQGMVLHVVSTRLGSKQQVNIALAAGMWEHHHPGHSIPPVEIEQCPKLI